MSSTSYANNLSKLRKIVTSVQSAIKDLETGSLQAEAIISDFQTFKHTTSDDPNLVEPGAILPLSNIAVIQVFTEIYTSQVEAKQKFICIVDIAHGRHNESSAAEFLHNDNERQNGSCLFTCPHIHIPLEITSSSTVDYLHEPTIGNLIQRNSVSLPPSLITTFNFANPTEHLPPSLELSSLDTPHTLDLLPPFCDLPDKHQRPYPVPSLQKGSATLSTATGSQVDRIYRAATSVFPFTELPTHQESS